MLKTSDLMMGSLFFLKIFDVFYKKYKQYKKKSYFLIAILFAILGIVFFI